MNHNQMLTDAAYEIALEMETEDVAAGGKPWTQERLEMVAAASLAAHMEDIAAAGLDEQE